MNPSVPNTRDTLCTTRLLFQNRLKYCCGSLCYTQTGPTSPITTTNRRHYFSRRALPRHATPLRSSYPSGQAKTCSNPWCTAQETVSESCFAVHAPDRPFWMSRTSPPPHLNSTLNPNPKPYGYLISSHAFPVAKPCSRPSCTSPLRKSFQKCVSREKCRPFLRQRLSGISKSVPLPYPCPNRQLTGSHATPRAKTCSRPWCTSPLRKLFCNNSPSTLQTDSLPSGVIRTAVASITST